MRPLPIAIFLAAVAPFAGAFTLTVAYTPAAVVGPAANGGVWSPLAASGFFHFPFPGSSIALYFGGGAGNYFYRHLPEGEAIPEFKNYTFLPTVRFDGGLGLRANAAGVPVVVDLGSLLAVQFISAGAENKYDFAPGVAIRGGATLPLNGKWGLDVGPRLSYLWDNPVTAVDMSGSPAVFSRAAAHTMLIDLVIGFNREF